MDSFQDLVDRESEEVVADSEQLFADSPVAPDSEAALGSADVVVSDEIMPVSEDVVPVSVEVAVEELFAGLKEVPVFVEVAVEELFAGLKEVPVSMEVAIKELFAGSKEVFMDGLVPPDSADVLASDEVMPFCANVITESVKEVPNSIEDVLGDDEVVHCPRCGKLHAGGVFGDACFEAHRNARRCARCGLLHKDYDRLVSILYGTNGCECEIYIPDVDKVIMDGSSIYLTNDVLKKLDEIYNMKKLEETKVKEDANKEH